MLTLLRYKYVSASHSALLVLFVGLAVGREEVSLLIVRAKEWFFFDSRFHVSHAIVCCTWLYSIYRQTLTVAASCK